MYFLDYREDGERIHKQVGKAPRDAWREIHRSGNGSIPDDGNEATDEATDTAGI